MMACGPENMGSIPRLAKVHNDAIFFLGVFMIQFNLIKLNLSDILICLIQMLHFNWFSQIIRFDNWAVAGKVL